MESDAGVYEEPDASTESPGDVRFAFGGKLTPPDGNFLDAFGNRIAIAGNVLVVGASNHDDGVVDSGAVYVFEKDAAGWQYTARLKATDPSTYASFGSAVAVHGTTIVVGSPDDDDHGASSGSLYVFERRNGQWAESAKLTADDIAAGDLFGYSVAIDDGMIAVGALRSDARGEDSGNAYVFENNNGRWVQTGSLSPEDSVTGDSVGHAVSISNNIIFVSASRHNSGTGAVYYFERRLVGWQEAGRIAPTEALMGEGFGSALASRDNHLVVGAMFADGNKASSGAAYIFQPGNGTWQQTGALTADDGLFGDRFGISVGTTGDEVVVGAIGDSTAGAQAGAVYVFQRRTALEWQQSVKIIADDGTNEDWFGLSVAIDDTYLAVGVPYDDDIAMDTGSVYIYERTEN